MSPKPYAIGGKCRKGHALTSVNTYQEGARLRCSDCRALWKPAHPRAPKTHCGNNHEFTEENSYWYEGQRACRQCRSDAVARGRTPGLGQGGFNRAKTHCPKKHEYTPDNTVLNKRGGRNCRECARINARTQNLKQYGITVEQYDAMLIAQSGRCWLCCEPFIGERGPHIDHDHACCPGRKSCGKCLRKLLCKDCNIGLGCFKDLTEVLRAAVEYLQMFRSPQN